MKFRNIMRIPKRLPITKLISYISRHCPRIKYYRKVNRITRVSEPDLSIVIVNI